MGRVVPMLVATALAVAAVGALGPQLGFATAALRQTGSPVALRGAASSREGVAQSSSTWSSSTAASVASLALVAAAASAARNRRAVPATARQALLSSCDINATTYCAFTGSTLQQAEVPNSTSMNLLMPKNIKWKKPHKPAIKPFRHSTKWKYKGKAVSGNKPHFGKYALQATEEAWVSAKQIESVRRALVRTMERKGKIWIRVFPHQAITKRVAESRMGAGKGGIEKWVQAVRPGFILFELDGVDELCAKTAFRKAGFRLPCKCKMLIKDTPSMWELGLAGKEKRVGAAGMDPRAAVAKKGKK